MTERGECGDCGIRVPGDSLTLVDGRFLCPRCFALSAPATLESAPRPQRTGSPWVARSGSSRSATTPAPGRAPAPAGAAERGQEGRSRLVEDARSWAAGRLWWVRAPVLAWLSWILFGYWSDPSHRTLFHGIDLAFHEIGHILWSPLGEFMSMAGGTLTQVLIPVAAGAVLYRQRDWFGVAFAVAWVGINCFEIAVYAGDALARRLPLVSPSTAEPIHDWTYMLGELDALQHTAAVAAAWRWAGSLFMGGGILFGAWLLWVMARAPAGTEPGAAPAGPGPAEGGARLEAGRDL